MLRAHLAQAALGVTSFVAPPAVALGVTATPPGAFDVPAALVAVAAAAPCPVDPRDLAAIQQKEAPSAVVAPDGTTSNPDGSPIRGDNGRSLGPFQFNLDGGAWSVYGNGSPDNYTAAAAATARMLCANNYAHDRLAAIARHNGSGPAAAAYAADVDAIARALPSPTAVPSRPTDGDSGCPGDTGRSRYALGAVVDRVWCTLVVGPWLALAQSGEHHAQWAAADRWLFGDDPVASPGGPLPTGTRAAGGVTCPVTAGLVVGDGWGAPRSGGRSHQGLDIFGTMGSPAVAPVAGTVIDSNGDEAAGGLGGRSVTIRATGGRWDGVEVYLAHLDTVDAPVGRAVREGEAVGTVGNSGNARGGDAHVHLQWHPGGAGPEPADAVAAACGAGGPPP